MCQNIVTILGHLRLVKTREVGRAKGQLQEAGREAWDRTFLSLRQMSLESEGEPRSLLPNLVLVTSFPRFPITACVP